jgi:hypothetical protein
MPVPNAIQAESQRACAKELLELGGSHRREVMAQLCFDRIAQKQEFLIDKFHTTDNWNETAYLMLLRSLDIKENRSSYERLAKVLPYRYFAKVGYERRSIEALLLGSAGLLPRLAEVFESEKEVAELQAIYDYDAHKFALEQMPMSDWQLTGHIGDNHPVIRLLQLASVLSQHEHLLNDILSCRTRSDVEKLFCSSSVPRWSYRFLSEDSLTGAITRTKAQMLCINVVAQLQIFYSEYTMRSDLDSRGIELLEQLPAESNLFMNRWQKLGIKAENALESQALLQLTKEYCSHLRCDKCLLRRFIDSE